jgi:hypothetical protein
MMAMHLSLTAAGRIASGCDAGIGVLAVHHHVLGPACMALSLPPRVTHKDGHKQDHRGKAGQCAGQDKGKQAVVAGMKIDRKAYRKHWKACSAQAHLQPTQGPHILRRTTVVKPVKHHRDPAEQVHMGMRRGKAEILGNAHVNAQSHATRSGKRASNKTKICHPHDRDLSLRPDAPRKPAGGQVMLLADLFGTTRCRALYAPGKRWSAFSGGMKEGWRKDFHHRKKVIQQGSRSTREKCA